MCVKRVDVKLFNFLNEPVYILNADIEFLDSLKKELCKDRLRKN